MNTCAQLEAARVIDAVLETGFVGRNEEQLCLVCGEEFAYWCPVGFPHRSFEIQIL